MKFIFQFILIFLFFACKEDETRLNEDFCAIAYDGMNYEIKLNDSLCFEVPKLKFILFLYHDSIFKVEIDRENKEHYSLLKGSTKSQDTLNSLFNAYQKTTLKGQLKDIKENGIKHGCFTNGYFLIGRSDQTQFGLFDFTKYYEWRTYSNSKEIELQSKHFPKIYHTIYHTLNSKFWDYMSDEYHLKVLRTHYTKFY